MLTQQDLKQIRTIVKEEVVEGVGKSESRVREEIGRVREEMRVMKTEIIVEVGEFLEKSIVPMIDEKADKKEVDQEIRTIKSHLGV